MFLWQKNKSTLLPLLGIVVVLLAGMGCTHKQTVDKGKEAMKHGNWDAAVYYYLEALAQEPDNIDYRIALVKSRQRAAQEHFRRGEALMELGQLVQAVKELEMAVQLDPTHQFAEQVLDRARADLEVLDQPDGAEALAEMKARAREAKVKPPVLNPRSNEPITLSFPKSKPLKEIYKAISKAYGFNILFDPKLKDNELAVELADVTAERALEITMQAAGHFYKVLDEHSIIVVEDTPQNRREYEDLVIKTFFLSNADVKEVDKLLRSLIEARRLSTNEQLNAITLRDTADKVAIAEKLIAVNDKAKAEVLVEVELLEADTTNLQEIGTKLSTQSFSLIPDLDRVSDDHPDGRLFLPDLGGLGNSSLWSINIPSVVVNLIKSSSEATLLAHPQMRITEGEKGALVIGDRIPIPVTSFNSSNSVGSNVVPITSFQYQDVGIKVDVEPRVHHNREITLKIAVEVSKVTGTVEQNNQEQPIIGTRNITTVIRLKQGETNMLVGLYKEEATYGKDEIPLLSKIPLIGRLFTNKSMDIKTTDLVLTLTPHIIRFPDIQEEDLAPLWVGTESRISFFGSRSPRVQSGASPQGPFDGQAGGRGRPTPGDEEASKREKTSPYHTAGTRNPALRRGGAAIRRPGATGEVPQGVDLVPGGGGKSGFLDDEQGGDQGGNQANPMDGGVDVSSWMPEPVTITMEPSVVSVVRGEDMVLKILASGGAGSYRLPLGLTFNAARLAVVGVAPGPGVGIADQILDDEGGFVGLELVVSEARELPHVVAEVMVSGREVGPVPIIFTSGAATAWDGSALPVAASDSAVLVIDGDGGS